MNPIVTAPAHDALGLLRVVLETAGAEVVTLSSAQEALQRLGERRPHALVVDLGMPDMDGFEFISRPMPDGRTPEPGGWNRIQIPIGDLVTEVGAFESRWTSFSQ
jgi:CheY-like chemotaxis protein